MTLAVPNSMPRCSFWETR